MPPAAATVDPSLRTRYADVQARIASAAARSGRRADDVLLVAVTKSATVGQILDLAALGHRDFGENRVQNLIDRVAEVDAAFVSGGPAPAGGPAPSAPGRGASGRPTADFRWHMIGSLQRNKVRKAIELSRLIHSVENMKLAETIHEEGMKRDRVVEVLLQVNIAGETSKHGMNPRAVHAVVEQMMTMAGLELRGLMCMAPLEADVDRTRPVFERCAELFADLRRSGAAGSRFDLLSMGMSGDFEIAIECGANIVRVGTAIFGTTA